MGRSRGTFHKLDKKEGDKYTQVGIVPYFGQGWHYTYGFTWGAEFFNYDECKVTPATDQMIAGSTWVQDFCKGMDADQLYAFIQNAMRNGAPPTDNPFIQGRMAGMINGNWMFAQFKNYMGGTAGTPAAGSASAEDVAYTFTPVPKDGDKSATWAGGWSGVVPQGAKNPEGGYAFVRYLCGADGQRTYVELNNNLPVNLELLKDKELLGTDLSWCVDNLFPTTHFRPPIPVGAKYWDELTTAWQAIYLNQSAPKDALETAGNNTQGDLDSGGFCPIAKPVE